MTTSSRPLSALRAALLATAFAAAGTSHAQPTEAEVTKIDKAQARITLRHGEIKNLDMPAMTMVFRIRDPKMLDALTKGDRVSFTAEKIDGNFVVTSISKAP